MVETTDEANEVRYWKIQYEYMNKEYMKLYNKLTAIRKVLDARDEGKII